MSQRIGRPNRVLDDWNMRLRAEPVGNSEKQPMLFFDFNQKYQDPVSKQWTFRDFYIGINLMNGAKNANQRFMIPPTEWSVFINALRLVSRSRKPLALKMPYLNYTWYDNKRSEEMKVEATIVVARDDDGVFVGYYAPRVEPVKFYVRPNNRYPTLFEGADALDLYDISALYGQAYADAWNNAVTHIFNTSWMDDDDIDKAKEIKKKENQRAFMERQKNNGGGQGGGGGSAPASNPWDKPKSSEPSYDEEIPWG